MLKRVDHAWIKFISGVGYWCIEMLNERGICDRV